MNIVLWVLQVLAGLAFIAAGAMKAFQPIATISRRMEWAGQVPAALVRFIGGSELLGGLGLILPALTGVLPWLTVAAALGLVVVMVLAAGFHAQRGEYNRIAPSLVLLVLVAIIAYGRWAVAPF